MIKCLFCNRVYKDPREEQSDLYASIINGSVDPMTFNCGHHPEIAIEIKYWGEYYEHAATVKYPDCEEWNDDCERVWVAEQEWSSDWKKRFDDELRAVKQG